MKSQTQIIDKIKSNIPQHYKNSLSKRIKHLFIVSHYDYCNNTNSRLELDDLVVITGYEKTYISQIAKYYGVSKLNRKVYTDAISKKVENPYKIDDKGCWIWQLSFDSNGYSAITRNSKTSQYRGTAHKYYYEQKYGKVPAGLILDHLCKDRRCINPDHLEVVTYKENARRGDNCKLTIEQVRELRRLAKLPNFNRIFIAKQFNITPQYLSNLIHNRTWKDEV